MREFYGREADVRVIDMHTAEGTELAASYGVTHVPAVVVNGATKKAAKKGGKK